MSSLRRFPRPRLPCPECGRDLYLIWSSLGVPSFFHESNQAACLPEDGDSMVKVMVRRIISGEGGLTVRRPCPFGWAEHDKILQVSQTTDIVLVEPDEPLPVLPGDPPLVSTTAFLDLWDRCSSPEIMMLDAAVPHGAGCEECAPSQAEVRNLGMQLGLRNYQGIPHLDEVQHRVDTMLRVACQKKPTVTWSYLLPEANDPTIRNPLYQTLLGHGRCLRCSRKQARPYCRACYLHIKNQQDRILLEREEITGFSRETVLRFRQRLAFLDTVPINQDDRWIACSRCKTTTIGILGVPFYFGRREICRACLVAAVTQETQPS